MNGTMQDHPLTLQHVLWRAGHLFAGKEIVTRVAGGVARSTYGDFSRRVDRLATALRHLGVGPGDRVATLCWNNQRHLEIYYAVPCMGAVLHTLNLRLFPNQLEFIVRDAADKILFVDQSLVPVLERLAGRMPSVQALVVIGDGTPAGAHGLGDTLDYEALLAAAGEGFDWPPLDERSAAGLCYTSGTTGNPKGVAYSHRSQFLHTMGVMQADSLAIGERDVILPAVPMFHANSWGIPYAAGMSGATLLMMDRWAGDAEAIVDLAASEHATIMAGVPTIWAGVLGVMERTGRRLPEVTRILCGGSAVPATLMEGMDRMGLTLLHAWGMTETSPVATLARPRSWQSGADESRARISQGAAVAGMDIRIADGATGEILPWDGEAFGEVQVRGPWVAAEYVNGADSGRLTDDGWFRTGDVATVDADGYVRIVDRTKDLIKSGGEWISSVELENAIMAHPKVLEAAVIAVGHPKWQERPVAYVVPRAEFKASTTQKEILDFLRDMVAGWWLPDEIRFIDEVPKTSVGKFDKKVLRAGAAPLEGAPPSG
ncbi:MAG: long-chain fatty acid--CoA ligase [Candidatus Dormibacteraceae bacterium]